MRLYQKTTRRDNATNITQPILSYIIILGLLTKDMTPVVFQCGARGFEEHRREREGVLQRRDRLEPKPQQRIHRADQS